MGDLFLTAADVAELRALLVAGAFPDAYRLLRPGARVPDGRGGFARVDATVEAGACALRPANTQGGEQAAVARLGWGTAYAVDLPADTLAVQTDALAVDGRRLEIGDVLRGGAWSLTATAICRESGPR